MEVAEAIILAAIVQTELRPEVIVAELLGLPVIQPARNLFLEKERVLPGGPTKYWRLLDPASNRASEFPSRLHVCWLTPPLQESDDIPVEEPLGLFLKLCNELQGWLQFLDVSHDSSSFRSMLMPIGISMPCLAPIGVILQSKMVLMQIVILLADRSKPS